ncbi:MAG: deaminase [Variovorax sp.]|nr:deaminase [Variovorax sp.]
MTDEDWMALALSEAHGAAGAGEVPVGAVLVKDGVVIARGRNAPIAQHDPSAHAEINALRAGAAALGNYRLDGCELFVTLEPCAMCAGAMFHARLARVVFGAADPKTGAAGSVVDLFAEPRLNHRTRVQGGVLEAPCTELLQTFFRQRREAVREGAEPLRDDALRTPPDRFVGLPDYPFTPRWIGDLQSLRGWRMHYADTAPSSVGPTLLCLHGPGEWSYFFRHLLAAPGPRMLAPDLIGFGMSDKPKREAVHRLAWHCDVLIEWLDRLQPGPVVLVHSAAATGLAAALSNAAPHRFAGVLAAPDGGDVPTGAWRAPFPDPGHEAALRALGRDRGDASAVSASSGPSPSQALQLVQDAMGYFRG